MFTVINSNYAGPSAILGQIANSLQLTISVKDISYRGGGGGLSDKCTYMYAHLYILL